MNLAYDSHADFGFVQGNFCCPGALPAGALPAASGGCFPTDSGTWKNIAVPDESTSTFSHGIEVMLAYAPSQ